jgi:FixJ family two-component response regulator
MTARDKPRAKVIACAGDVGAGSSAAMARARSAFGQDASVCQSLSGEAVMPRSFSTGWSDALRPCPTVYMMDPDPAMRTWVHTLARSANLEARSLSGVEDCLRAVEPDSLACIVAKAHAPGASALEVLRALVARRVFVPIIVLAEEQNLSIAVAAMKAGAFDVVEKTRVEDRLQGVILAALTEQLGRRERRHVEDDIRGRYAQLTPREREVCHLVAAGCRSRVIAGRLGLSEKTIEVYRSRVNQKMKTHSAVELAHLLNCLEF